MIQLDPTSRIPVYQQIKEQMTGLIVMGVFPPESRLPSVRALAAETGLNPNTIQKAYQELESEGVIYTVGGKGCFVGGEENAAEATCRRAEAELREALRQARLAGEYRDPAGMHIWTGGAQRQRKIHADAADVRGVPPRWRPGDAGGRGYL